MRWCYAAIVHVRFASVSGGITHRWLLDTKPSGRPGHGRAGRWRRQCQSSRRKFLTVGPALPACCQPQTARRFRINGVVVYSYSTGTARERGGVYPARTSSCAHSFGPSRPRFRRPSANRTMPVFVGVWEPEVSQPLHRQSPPAPPHQTASGTYAPLRSAPSMFRDSGPGIRISFSCKLTGSTRPAVPVQRLKTIKANQETYAPKSVLIPAPYHAWRTVTRFIYIPQGAAADAAAASLLGNVKCMSVGPDFGLPERVPHVPLY